VPPVVEIVMLFAPALLMLGTVTEQEVVLLAEQVADTPPTVAVVEPTTKFVPVTVSTSPFLPLEGLTVEMVGARKWV